MPGVRDWEFFVEEEKECSMRYSKKQIKELEYIIVGAAIEVHRHLGPGLLETVYHKCMLSELVSKNISFKSELHVPLIYKNTNLEVNLRCDILVEDMIVVELKSTELLTPIFDAQLLTYMKLLQSPKGILLNFNCVNIAKEGRKSLVNEIYAQLRNE